MKYKEKASQKPIQDLVELRRVFDGFLWQKIKLGLPSGVIVVLEAVNLSSYLSGHSIDFWGETTTKLPCFSNYSYARLCMRRKIFLIDCVGENIKNWAILTAQRNLFPSKKIAKRMGHRGNRYFRSTRLCEKRPNSAKMGSSLLFAGTAFVSKVAHRYSANILIEFYESKKLQWLLFGHVNCRTWT